jgi:aryl-alcohol dehydrogenase-like predicted oxidoreductase
MTEKRKLGSSGLEVSPLVAGGNVFGWTADEKTSFDVLDAFAGGGVTMIDTADVYSSFVPGHVGGESETIIGKWMKARGNRSQVQIATKVGIQEIDGQKGIRRDVIAKGIELSLKRLQTDYIDLYYAHFDFADVPQDESAEAFDRLMKAGKVRAIGASNFVQARLDSALDTAKAHGQAAYSVLQPNFNLMSKEQFPPEYRSWCAEHDIGVLPYYALAAGFLTGKYRTIEEARKSSRGESPAKFFNARGEKVLATLAAVAEEAGVTQAQVAVAWIIATPGITAPIASATKVAQVESLLAAMELKLSDAHMARLNEAANTPI